MKRSIVNSVRTLAMLLFGFGLLGSGEGTDSVLLTDRFGKGSYLPTESPLLNCDYGNISKMEVFFFRDGQKINNEEDLGYFFVDAGNNILSLLIFSFADEFSGNYSCEVTTTTNVVISSNIVPITSAEYSIDITDDLEHPPGIDLQLSCILNSDRTDVSYKWDVPNSDSDLSGQLLSLTDINSNYSGLYICKITLNSNALGGELTAQVTVTVVDQAPKFSESQRSLMVEKEMAIELSCSAQTVGSTSYSWFRYGNLVTNTSRITVGSITNTLTISDSQFSDAGNYICQAANLFGPSHQTWDLIVFGPPSILVNGSEIELCEGEQISLPCNQTSVPDANISWVYQPLNQDAIEPQMITYSDRVSVGLSSELVISKVELDDSGYFICNASNEYGSENIQHKLIVIGKPETPSGVEVAETLSTSVKVIWSPYISSEQRQADNFLVELSDNGGSTFIEYKDVDINLTETLIDGLVPSTNYTLRLVARNKAGNSDPSKEVVFQTENGVPKLGSVVVTPIEGGRSLLIEWTVEYTGGSPITELYALVTPKDGNVQRTDLDIGSTSQEIGGLEPFTEYSVSLNVANALGPATENVQPETITTPRGPPGMPSRPAILSSNSVSATIEVNISSLGSEAIKYFLVDIIENAVHSQQLNLSVYTSSMESDTSGSYGWTFELVITGLLTSYTYSFSVAGGGQLGHGEFSEYSDTITITDTNLLYVIIGAVVGSAIALVVIFVTLTICAACAKRRSKLRQITISTDPSANDVVFPNSPSSRQNMYKDICDSKDPSPTFYDNTVSITKPDHSTIPHHKRTHSSSSTASSHMGGTPMKMFMAGQSPSVIPESHLTAGGSYTGSITTASSHMGGVPMKAFMAEQSPSVIAENYIRTGSNYTGSVTDRMGMLHPGSCSKQIGWFSSPIINRMSYDVDALTPQPSYSTDV